MLWIECYDDSLINIAHVSKIRHQHFMVGVDGPAIYWLVADIVGVDEPIKVAYGKTEESCKVMKHRIQTYLGLDHNYNDRNVIRYNWLTHKLP